MRESIDDEEERKERERGVGKRRGAIEEEVENKRRYPFSKKGKMDAGK